MQTFWDVLLSLSIMHLRFIQVVESVNSLFFFIAVYFSITGYDTICVIYSPSKDTWLVSSFGNYDACLGPSSGRTESKTRVTGSPHSLGSQILWLERKVLLFQSFGPLREPFGAVIVAASMAMNFSFIFGWGVRKEKKNRGFTLLTVSPSPGGLSVSADAWLWVLGCTDSGP